MELQEYLKVHGRQAALAAATGLSPSYISQISKGVRPAPTEHGAKIEAATNGLVTRKDLFPKNWQTIWPELATLPADGEAAR